MSPPGGRKTCPREAISNPWRGNSHHREEQNPTPCVDAATVGAALSAGLARELAGIEGVVDIRGAGLMIGIELARPCGILLNRAAEAGLLISVTADKVVRLVPSLILSEDEAAQIVAILCPLIKDFLAEPAAA